MFNYKWNMKEDYPKEKNGYKVFSCFAGSGGSTMGYKLAGYDVLGANEIDPKMANIYKLNHNPKYLYVEKIQDFKNRTDLPEDLYNLDILDGSFPCFEGNVLIYTAKGFRPIKDINIDDYVLTHTNTFQRVIKKMRKITNEYYQLKIQGQEKFKVTKEHPFYIRTMERDSMQHRKFTDPCWKNVEDLRIIRDKNNQIQQQDYIGMAINRESKTPKWDGVLINNKRTNTLDFNNQHLWYLIGRFIGDGWIRVSKGDNKPKRETPKYKDKQEKCLNCNELSKQHSRHKKQWTSYCSEKCRLQYKAKMKKSPGHRTIICCGHHEYSELKNKIELYTSHYTIAKERTTYKFHLCSKELTLYLSQFGQGAKNKELTNDILDLPINLLKYFLQGYLDADGHYDKKGKWNCSSISKRLIIGIQQCILKVYGQPTSMSIKDNSKYSSIIEGRCVNTNMAYTLSFFKEKRKQQHGFYENGYLWIPFRKKEKITNSLEVFNLSVKEDESYTVNNLICHNCSSFSITGIREKGWGKEKKFKEGQAKQVLDTLVFEFIDLVEKLQPKVAIGENVVGLTMGNAKKYLDRILVDFNKIGYAVNYSILDGSRMGLPQKRRRVFIYAIRKDLKFPFIGFTRDKCTLNLKFNERPIKFKKIKDEKGLEINKENKELWRQRNIYDRGLNKVNMRVNKSVSLFNYLIVKPDDILPTFTGEAYRNILMYEKPIYISQKELILGSSFPLDFVFNEKEPENVISTSYMVGMSVPPIMMARLAKEIQKQWLDRS